MNRIPIDVDFIRGRFNYDPNTGNISFAGDDSEYEPRKLNTGNVVINVRGMDEDNPKKKLELVGGRFAWAYQTGEDPGEYEVQYKNGDQSDLRFANLYLGNPISRRNNRQQGNNCIVKPDGTLIPEVSHKGKTRRLRHVSSVAEKDALVNGAKAVIKAASLAGQDTLEAFLEYCREHKGTHQGTESTTEVTDESV